MMTSRMALIMPDTGQASVLTGLSASRPGRYLR
jgi:hypothetical protein